MGKIDSKSANDAVRSILYEKTVNDPLSRFADTHPIADAEMWQAAIIKLGTPWDSTCFAEQAKGADTAALQQVVLERGNGWDIYEFACRVSGADLSKLRDRLTHLRDIEDDDENGYMVKFDGLIAERSRSERTARSAPTMGKRSSPKQR